MATEKQETTTSFLSSTKPEDLSFDVVIIGAGISGINAAYRLQHEGPSGTTYAILEGRDSLGGTWDLFRYPGIRSDSDIFTFGFSWSPWQYPGNLAAGENIKEYMADSARAAGIDQHICFQHAVKSADWSAIKRKWQLKVLRPGDHKPVTFEARHIILGTGYYDYDKPLEADIPGIDSFKGEVIHPQLWPDDFDYANKDVVVIGSGATAITLVPSMAPKARSVTMLQRSPTYVFSIKSSDAVRGFLFRWFPAWMAHLVNRFFWILKSTLSTGFCKRYPELAKRLIRRATMRQLPARISWDPHFKPRYNPWEQRFCASQDGDFFAALRSGKADVVSGTIRAVTEGAIVLDSGRTLEPDVIITATGLRLKFGGGIAFSVDGVPFEAADKFTWRSTMLQDVPNLFYMNGYEAASWTLGADVSAKTTMRILRDMDGKGATVAVPRVPGRGMVKKPMMTLSSTYLERAADVLPMAGEGQWQRKSHYLADLAGALWGDVTTDLEVS